MTDRTGAVDFLTGGETREALRTGGGFALAFGWAWSAALRDAWLADILTGSLFSGQGASLFFGAMFVVFLAGGFFMDRPRLAARFSPARFVRVAHGAASLPLLAWLLTPGAGKISAAAVCLGLAGGLSGLYWGARLVLLRPRFAALALAVAMSVVAALAGFLRVLSPAPPSTLLTALCVSSLLAWLAASRYPVGGPFVGAGCLCPQSSVELLLTFAALGALFSADAYVFPQGALLVCSLEFLGAALALPLSLAAPTIVARGFFLPLLSTLLFLACFWPSVFAWGLHLGTGVLLGGAATRLAAPRVAKAQGNGGLAGYALAGLFLSVNAGFFLGARAPLLGEAGKIGLALLFPACFVLVFFLPRLRGGWARRIPPAAPTEPGGGPGEEAAGTAPGDRAALEQKRDAENLPETVLPDPGLTRAERRIGVFLAQGLSNAAISDALGTAPATVRVHLRSIHKKMKTTSRKELLAALQAAGIR